MGSETLVYEEQGDSDRYRVRLTSLSPLIDGFGPCEPECPVCERLYEGSMEFEVDSPTTAAFPHRQVPRHLRCFALEFERNRQSCHMTTCFRRQLKRRC